MNPIDFEKANLTWYKPLNMKNCESLKVYRSPDEEYSISCWQTVSWKERIRFLFTGIMWLWVYGPQHPPVCVSVKDPFAK